MRGRGLMRRLAVVGALLALAGGEARAQRQTVLTVATFPLVVTTTTGNDFENGSVALGSLNFSVNATTNSPAFSPRETTVQIMCVAAACPNQGTLSLTGLQWRLGVGGTWTQLTTAYVTVETRDVVFSGSNDPWSNDIYFRYVLSWTGNPPTASQTRWRIRFRLVVAPA